MKVKSGLVSGKRAMDFNLELTQGQDQGKSQGKS